MTLELNHFFKDRSSKYSYVLRYLGLGLLHMDIWGGHSSAYNTWQPWSYNLWVCLSPPFPNCELTEVRYWVFHVFIALVSYKVPHGLSINYSNWSTIDRGAFWCFIRVIIINGVCVQSTHLKAQCGPGLFSGKSDVGHFLPEVLLPHVAVDFWVA